MINQGFIKYQVISGLFLICSLITTQYFVNFIAKCYLFIFTFFIIKFLKNNKKKIMYPANKYCVYLVTELHCCPLYAQHSLLCTWGFFIRTVRSASEFPHTLTHKIIQMTVQMFLYTFGSFIKTGLRFSYHYWTHCCGIQTWIEQTSHGFHWKHWWLLICGCALTLSSIITTMYVMFWFSRMLTQMYCTLLG